MSERTRSTQEMAVISAANELLREGLVARTWGNLSARLPEGDHFVITPSGRDYRDLQGGDLVEVDLDGLWHGERKPSSEKGIHAVIYRERSDADFIIHTHQPYASALSLGRAGYKVSAELAELIGSQVLPIADYGLPSTKKLHNAIFAAVKATGSRAILMRAHGLIVFAASAEEALQIARAVEKFCKSVYLTRVSIEPQNDVGFAAGTAGDVDFGGTRVWLRTSVQSSSPEAEVGVLGREDRAKAEIAALFAARPDVQCIIGESDPAVMAHSTGLKPYLDDFAQIVGLNATSVQDVVDVAGNLVHSKIVPAVRRIGVPDLGVSNVAFGQYAYCLGKGAEDAQAVQMVLHKNALAASFGKTYAAKPIKTSEALLMHGIYAVKYSKLKDA